MPFNQSSFVRQENPGGRDVFVSYNYKTDDPIVDVLDTGYFARMPRYDINPLDIVRVQCADGFYICSFLTDGSSVQVEIAPSSTNFEDISTEAVPYTISGGEDTVLLTGAGAVTLIPSILANKSVILKSIDSTVTITTQNGDSIDQATITAGNSVRLTPNQVDAWYAI